MNFPFNSSAFQILHKRGKIPSSKIYTFNLNIICLTLFFTMIHYHLHNVCLRQDHTVFDITRDQSGLVSKTVSLSNFWPKRRVSSMLLSICFLFSLTWTHADTMILTSHLFKALIVCVPFVLVIRDARNVFGSGKCEPT